MEQVIQQHESSALVLCIASSCTSVSTSCSVILFHRLWGACRGSLSCSNTACKPCKGFNHHLVMSVKAEIWQWFTVYSYVDHVVCACTILKQHSIVIITQMLLSVLLVCFLFFLHFLWCTCFFTSDVILKMFVSTVCFIGHTCEYSCILLSTDGKNISVLLQCLQSEQVRDRKWSQAEEERLLLLWEAYKRDPGWVEVWLHCLYCHFYFILFFICSSLNSVYACRRLINQLLASARSAINETPGQ